MPSELPLQIIDACRKSLIDASKVKDELEKKIKVHMQLQEQISVLENVSGFKSEEELNVMIQDCEAQKIAYKNATELHAQLTKFQEKIGKLKGKIQKGLASPEYIPARKLLETMTDINIKQDAIQTAQTLRRKIDQTKRSPGLLTENELKRAKYVLQNIEVWLLLQIMVL